MQFKIVTVGRMRKSYLRTGIAEYQKWLQPYASVQLVDVA